MKRSKKLQQKLEARIKEWEATIQRNSHMKGAYKKPGSQK